MDEYSPKRHDIAQLRFLNESLYDEGIATLGDSHHGWVNDPTSAVKYPYETNLSDLVEEYLDDTYTLFSNYGINDSDLRQWQKTKKRLFRMFSGDYVCTLMKT
jgi:hha toxicity modulator TomB